MKVDELLQHLLALKTLTVADHEKIKALFEKPSGEWTVDDCRTVVYYDRFINPPQRLINPWRADSTEDGAPPKLKPGEWGYKP